MESQNITWATLDADTHVLTNTLSQNAFFAVPKPMKKQEQWQLRGRTTCRIIDFTRKVVFFLSQDSKQIKKTLSLSLSSK